MTYLFYMAVFIETPIFSARIGELLSDDEYRDVQQLLLLHPEAGAVIPECKGIRKLRWSAKGHGKKGGVRILYYWAVAPNQILFLHIFPKNKREDLTKKQYKILMEYVRRDYP